MVSEEIKDAVIDNTRNLLLGHVAVGRLTSSQISDNQIVETASPLKSTVRMNVYQRPVKVLLTTCSLLLSFFERFKKQQKMFRTISHFVLYVGDR